jgi:hypothetical protein
VSAAWRLLRSRRDHPWPGFGEAFNGQQIRTQTIEGLLADFEPDALLETATFYGFTTEWLVRRGLPVYSVELDAGLRNVARMRLRGRARIELGDEPIARPFVYLDAHWGEHLPLAEEVCAVFDQWDDALIVIDDFLVPDSDYGYDEYAGRALSIELLDLPADSIHTYPPEPAADETGARRGTLYVARGERSTSALRKLHGRSRQFPSSPRT